MKIQNNVKQGCLLSEIHAEDELAVQEEELDDEAARTTRTEIK